jgi:hypothetical protein
MLTPVHPATEEMDLGSGGLGFVSASDEAIALVNALRRIDGEDLS